MHKRIPKVGEVWTHKTLTNYTRRIVAVDGEFVFSVETHENSFHKAGCSSLISYHNESWNPPEPEVWLRFYSDDSCVGVKVGHQNEAGYKESSFYKKYKLVEVK